MLHRDQSEVKKEAAWAVSNAASSAQSTQIRAFVTTEIIEGLCTLIDDESQSVKIVMVVLEAFENFLRAGMTLLPNKLLPLPSAYNTFHRNITMLTNCNYRHHGFRQLVHGANGRSRCA